MNAAKLNAANTMTRSARRQAPWPWPVALLLVMIAVCPAAARADDTPAAPAPAAPDSGEGADLAKPPTWQVPSHDEVERTLQAWLERSGLPAERRQAALAFWGERGADPAYDRLDVVMGAVTEADPRCLPVLAVVPATPGVPPVTAAALPAWVAEEATDGFERGVVRLWLGRELVRQERFDDGLVVLAGLEPEAVVDPASLLFHTAACQHWLLRADDCIASLDRLLERSAEIPVRYERVARLLRADMTGLEEESLDHIARRMRDITRRLGQGRAGPVTRQVQDGVIDSLDKLIAAIEEKQNQQSGGGGAPGSGNSGNGKPMDDSRIAGGQGAGEVTRRDLGEGEGWGNLPPHEREQALQQIGREFPAHYREAIEQYFKRLAAGESTP